MKRLIDANNNCTKELQYCLDKKGLEKIILVIFDPELKNRENWNDVTRFLLPQCLLFIDLSGANAVERNLKHLVEEVRR